MAASIKLSDVLNFCLPMTNNFPLAQSGTNQPFLGFCNMVAGVLLTPPFKPNFNRATVNFTTVSGTQTYMPAGQWVLATNYTAGTVIMDSNGNGQKALVTGTSGSTVPSWSTTLFFTTLDQAGSPPGSMSWQNVGQITSISQVTNFSFIERAEVQDVNNGSVWKTLNVVLDLPHDNVGPSCPKYVCAQSDDNLGDISFRLSPTPNSVYPVAIQYQLAQAPYTSLSQTFAPLPDRLYYCYLQGILSLCYLYKGDLAKSQESSQKFVGAALAYYEGLSESQINAFQLSWSSSLADVSRQLRVQQGNQARGV